MSETTPPFDQAKIVDVITYPVKSLAGVSHPEGRLITELGLDGDRAFTLAKKEEGLNGAAKRLTLREHPRLAQIDTEYVDGGVLLTANAMGSLLLRDTSEGETVSINSWGGVVSGIRLGEEADAWLSEFLETPAQILSVPDNPGRRRVLAEEEQRPQAHPFSGRATDGYPLHVIFLPTLRRLNKERRSRGLRELGAAQFRANVVIDGPNIPPYIEDSLDDMRFKDSRDTIDILGLKACKRCVTIEVVPSKGEKLGDVLETLLSLQDERIPGTKLDFGIWAAPALTSIGASARPGQLWTPSL